MKINKVLAGLAVGAVAMFAAAPSVNAAVTCPADSLRANKSAESYADCNIPENSGSVIPTVVTVINFAIGIVGIVAVAMMVIAGVGFTTSAGDPAKAKKARDTMLYAVVGLIVAILSWAIVNFVLSGVFGGGSAGGGGTTSTPATSSGATSSPVSSPVTTTTI